MHILRPILLGTTFALAAGTFAVAQDSPSSGPPKVIQIVREWLKPGKAGMVHDRSEAAFVSLMNRAKLQGHYVALNSMSGKSRALYITRYPSFQAWESDNKTLLSNASFSADYDRAVTNDGELLDSLDQSVFTYDEELSYHPHSDISHARFYEISVFKIHPGHRKDWYGLTKMYKEICDKAQTTDHWATYEAAYGVDAGTYISLTARNSLTEIDDSIANFKKFVEAAGGEEGMNKLDELYGQAVESSRTELFSVNPKQSYVYDAWIKADPDFWKPKAKTAEAATTKPAPKAPAPPAAKPSSR